jgi:hypothetical protein
MARSFVAASSQYANISSAIGNFEYNQAFSVAFWFRGSAAFAYGAIVSKTRYVSGASLRGWQVFFRPGTGGNTVALEIANDDGPPNAIVVHTNTSYAGLTWHHCVVIYSGTRLVIRWRGRVRTVESAPTSPLEP